MGHDGVASSYPTPTGFRRLTGYQWDPRDRVSHLLRVGSTALFLSGHFLLVCCFDLHTL